MENLNPQIQSVQYGRKGIKEFIVYPLSIASQFKMTNTIVTAIVMLAPKIKNISDSDFAVEIVKALSENISEVLQLSTDLSKEECDTILGDMTNNQFMGLLEVIWVMNYEGSVKNGLSLFERAKSLFPSKRSSQQSLSDTPNID